MAVRVAIIEDQEIFRRGLAAALLEDPGLEVALEAAGGPIELDNLDVAVVSWHALAGVDLGCPMVVLAGRLREAPPDRERSISAVLPRNGLTADRLIAAVRAAAAGLRVNSDAAPPAAPHLDDRRLEVLRLLAQGADTRLIARTLRCSERTVKGLVHDVELTLGASNRAQAVAEGIRFGLI